MRDGMPRAGEADHFVGQIDAEHAAARHEGGQLGGDTSIAAADIQDRFVAL